MSILLVNFVMLEPASGTSFSIGLELSVVDANLLGVMPGDTLILEPGKRRVIRINNIKGDSLNYVLIRNGNGDVIIENDDLYYGFVISNSSFFRLTGNVNNENNFGIKILKTGKGANGLGIGELSTNYEIDHLEIANTGFAGIFAFSQPTCDLIANRGFFEQRNCIFRNNYIHDTYGEGMYLGHSFYTGYTIKCNKEDTKVYPHEIKGLKVYDNLVENAGYDGIQVGCAVEGTEVYNNKILNYGTANEIMQHSGIQIAAGTKIRCYNNQIITGSGTGITMMGLADSYIYNNLIVNPGKDFFPNDVALRIHGIFVDDRLIYKGTSHYIFNNTIISPKSDGIRFISTETSKSLLANNLIVNPGSNYTYETNDAKYIYLQKGADVRLDNNFFSNFVVPTMLVDSLNSIYESISNFPLSGKGIDISIYGVNQDLMGVPRAMIPSIGCFELPVKNNIFNVKKDDIDFLLNNETGLILIENKSIDMMKQVAIFDLSGRKVLNFSQNEPRFFMTNIKGLLRQGIYILSVERNRSVFKHKFVVVN
ncbi:MAG: hypothetical protein AUK44_09570 [Porphyromonadaceae bacterium CG2_30_38_12]|nr:MAG: hypothetical protein AUK44_09570 [Porphyromonadaceae bacterium CG2_30_38_12]